MMGLQETLLIFQFGILGFSDLVLNPAISAIAKTLLLGLLGFQL
jgi:hypothetical protein